MSIKLCLIEKHIVLSHQDLRRFDIGSSRQEGCKLRIKSDQLCPSEQSVGEIVDAILNSGKQWLLFFRHSWYCFLCGSFAVRIFLHRSIILQDRLLILRQLLLLLLWHQVSYHAHERYHQYEYEKGYCDPFVPILHISFCPFKDVFISLEVKVNKRIICIVADK